MNKRLNHRGFFILMGLFFLIPSLSACGKVEIKQDEELLTVIETVTELPSKVPPLKDYGGIGGDFTLTDHHGNKFSLSELEGHPVLLFFGYTYYS